jgi:hypothetical protein
MRRFRHLLCWLMTFAVPVSLSASEGNPAMLSGTGDIKINGSSAMRSSAVYAGDRVATGENSRVTVSLKGTVITAPSHSSVIYRGSDVELGYGSVIVNTQSAMKGHLGNLTVTPNAGKAKFELTETNQVARVTTLQGEVDVTDGIHSVTLPAGQMLTRAALNSSDDQSSIDSTKDQTSKGTAPKPAFKKRGIPGWIWGVAAAGAVGVGLAASGAVGGSSSPTSPSRP